MKKLNNILFISVFCSILFYGCGQKSKTQTSRVETLPYYNDASFTPKWINEDDQQLDTFHRIPDFKLYNQNSELINKKTFAGKIYVANFFFTSCPGICPKMQDNMIFIQKEFLDNPDVLLLSHSVTPEKDSIPLLKEYADKRGIISKKWHLVTGNQKEIYDLGRRSYFVEEDLGVSKKDDEFLHTENFVLIDRQGYIRGIYNGLNKSSVNQLIIDIKTLL